LATRKASQQQPPSSLEAHAVLPSTALSGRDVDWTRRRDQVVDETARRLLLNHRT
jgi:hypothetical protein